MSLGKTTPKEKDPITFSYETKVRKPSGERCVLERMNATRIDKPTEAAKEIIESMNRYHHPPPDRRHIVAEFETISGVDDGEELFEALKRRGEIYRGTNGWVVT